MKSDQDKNGLESVEKERNFPCPKKLVVLDTSVFSDPQSRKWLGDDIQSAIKNFIKLASDAKDIEFYMPRSIRDELQKLIGENIPYLENIVYVKSPAIFELTIPAGIFYEFLDDLRSRIDRGLRVSEKLIRHNQTLTIDDRIRKLREGYRTAFRKGIVDSKEDFEVILLAKQINAMIVTADQGLLKYADKLGISIMDAHLFPEFLIYEAEKYNKDLQGIGKEELITK
ncbi:MAG: RNA ligase partner protein [Candidatus Hodarchaeales archaeon]|jgi:RNA ligase partner protein